MRNTAIDLVRKFNPASCFTISDEISLVFPAVMPSTSSHPEPMTDESSDQTKPRKKRKETVKVHSFNGRIQKIASVTSAYASSRFNFHLCTPGQWNDMSPSLKDRMTSHEAHFDGRVIPVPNAQSAAECIYWYKTLMRRSNFDGFRNAISQIGTNKYGQELTHGKSVEALLGMLADDGVDIFTAFPMANLFGTFVKRVDLTYSGTVRDDGRC
jgi:tRNA(His) guanylyltransferase